MKVLSTLLLFGLLAGHYFPATAAPCHLATQQTTAPEAEFNAIGKSAMVLVQRALHQRSNADAIAILQKEGAAIRQRAQKLRPAYSKWYNNLNAREVAGVRERIQQSSFGGYFGSLETDPELSIRLRNNPALSKAVDSVTSALDMR